MTDVTLTDRPAGANPVVGASRARLVLGIVLVSYFMIVLDNSIIFTGLPQIQTGLGLSGAGLSWVQNAHTLVFGGLLLGARAGDLLGRRRVFIAGLNAAHQLGSTLGVAGSTTVSAGVATLAGRVNDAYLGGAVLVAVALIAALVLIWPAEHAYPHRGRAS